MLPGEWGETCHFERRVCRLPHHTSRLTCLLAGTGDLGGRQPTHPGPFMAADNEKHGDRKRGLVSSCLLFLILYVPQSSENLTLSAPHTPLLCPILLLVLFYFSPEQISPTLPGSLEIVQCGALESGLGLIPSPLAALTTFFQPLLHIKLGTKLQGICGDWLEVSSVIARDPSSCLGEVCGLPCRPEGSSILPNPGSRKNRLPLRGDKK